LDTLPLTIGWYRSLSIKVTAKYKKFYIGQLARIAGVTVQTMRYYEKRSLVLPRGRDCSGYRIYDEKALKRLRLIGWGKGLGFTLEEMKELLDLHEKGPVECAWVRVRASEKLASVERKLSALTETQERLRSLLSSCTTHDEGECLHLKKIKDS